MVPEKLLQVVIPFKLQGAKSRLSPVLSIEERSQLALAMLEDVLDALSGLGDMVILSRSGSAGLDNLPGCPKVISCDLELNESLNLFLDSWQNRGWPKDIMIAMADLALLDRFDVEALLDTKGDVVLSPGRGGGTNLILVRSPLFRTCYHGYSFLSHRDLVNRLGLELGTYASYGTGCDVDEPADLAEVLIHGQGKARRFLEGLGIQLTGKGRAGVTRVA